VQTGPRWPTTEGGVYSGACAGVEGGVEENSEPMTLIQRWKQTAIHNKALVWTSILVAFGTLFYAAAAGFQLWLMQTSAASSAAQVDRLVMAINKGVENAIRAADTATQRTLQDNRDSLTKALAQNDKELASSLKQNEDALGIQQRPWVKISNRIVSPLTFDIGGRASGKPVAMATIEDRIENVGPTLAVEVRSWEDIIPMGPGGSIERARARQKEWCDANRHVDPNSLFGYALFPHDPHIQQSNVGPTMESITDAMRQEQSALRGKAGFILVGCVCYKASFESENTPSHQTRFMYFLGVPQDVGFNPYVAPSGVANQLLLISMPLGFNAD
jgi:hypothetical protein